MPVLWRYLLVHYVKVLTLAVVTFIALLMVSRLKQIAALAALGASWSDIARFGLYLIPYILPLAIPISCLLSTVILFQRLSHMQELTALRSGGFALLQVATPILIAGAALAMANFYVASELATHSHMLGKRLQSQMGTVNPLLLFQNTKFLKLGEMFVDMRTVRSGEEAQDVTCVVYNPGSERLNLLSANHLEMEGDDLHGKGAAVVTSFHAEEEGFDHLVIENQQEMWVPVASFGHFIKPMHLQLKNDHLRLPLLLARLRTLDSPTEIARGRSEIARRVSIALAVFTFSLMGCAFGMEISRRKSKRGLLLACVLSALFITTFCLAGGMSSLFWLALLLYFVPHLLIIGSSILHLKRITRGVET